MPLLENKNLIDFFYKAYLCQNINSVSFRYGMKPYKVRALLSELDVFFNHSVFVKIKEKLVPTSFADDLFSKIDNMVHIPENYVRTILNEQVATGGVGSLIVSIACTPYIGSVIFPLIYKLDSTLGSSRVAIQHVDITPYNKFTKSLAICENIDVIFDEMPVIHPEFSYKKLLKEDMVILCSENHPRLSRAVTAKEFSSEVHAFLDTPDPEMSLMQKQLKEQFPEIRVGFTASSYLDIFSVVESTELVCVAPQFMYSRIQSSFKINSLSCCFNLIVRPVPLYMSYRNSLKDEEQLTEFYRGLHNIN